MRILDAKSTDCYVVTLEVNGDELVQLRQGQAPAGSTLDPLGPLQKTPDHHGDPEAARASATDRRALFALWGEAFPGNGDVLRHDFTRQVLGEYVSWADLTRDQYQTLRVALTGAKVARDYLT
jgi:hypothetical protein